jgi:hypothetical protein
MQEQVNNEETMVESQVEQPKEEKKESLVSVAPRHIGKAKIKKGPSYDDLQKTKAIADVKLWSQRVLESQIASKICPKEMKEACEAELKARKEKREKILNK